jgi:hypothetical protein
LRVRRKRAFLPKGVRVRQESLTYESDEGQAFLPDTARNSPLTPASDPRTGPGRPHAPDWIEIQDKRTGSQAFLPDTATMSPLTSACDSRDGRGRPHVSDWIGHQDKRTGSQARKPDLRIRVPQAFLPDTAISRRSRLPTTRTMAAVVRKIPTGLGIGTSERGVRQESLTYESVYLGLSCLTRPQPKAAETATG